MIVEECSVLWRLAMNSKINGGEMRRLWELPGMSEEEVAFYQRFVARHGGALVAMGKAQKSYRRDFSPGTLHGSGEPFAFFDFMQPGRLCTRRRPTGAQPGISPVCDTRAASAGTLLSLRVFFLINFVIQLFHRNTQVLGYASQGDICWSIGWIVTHAPDHVDREVRPSRDTAYRGFLALNYVLHSQPVHSSLYFVSESPSVYR